MSETFTQLGIPFSLFEAPASESSKYVGLGLCSLCGASGVHCFAVDALIIACAKCGKENAIRTYPGESGFCTSCRQNMPGPASGSDALASCYQCLRAGRTAFTKDTVLGMVTWDQAIEGLTQAPYPAATPCNR